jgi:hypothetical protein
MPDMSVYDEMRYRLIAAFATGAALSMACGGSTSGNDRDTDPENVEVGSGGASEPGPTSGSGGAEQVPTVTPTSTPTSPPVSPVSCPYGNGVPERACYTRDQLENLVRYGGGQIPLDPPRTDAEVAAAFLSNGCTSAEYVFDGCCNPAVSGPEKDGDLCCYLHCTGACCGRPLFVDGIARIAPAVVRADWLLENALAEPAPAETPPDIRDGIAAAWLADALLEHESVASFSRWALELLAVAAPPGLVLEAHRAALDEVEHARLCFALAERFSGECLGPGPLALSDVRVSASLDEMVALAIREGCVGETLASLVAREQLAVARDRDVQRALSRIAEDEARHAELAWRFVAWAISSGGDRIRSAARRAFDEALGASDTFRDAPEHPARMLPMWHDAGRLNRTELESIARRARREVIAVAAAALLTEMPATRTKTLVA